MKRHIILFGLFVFLIACKKDDPQIESSSIPTETNLRINSYKVNCSGYEGQTDCYLVQHDNLIGTEEWEYFYEQIEGFDYREGFIYNLQVRSEDVANPLADAPNKKYFLVKLLSKIAVK